MSDFPFPEVVQGDPEVHVTRQTGIDLTQQESAADPMLDRPVIQGDAETAVTRQTGNGAAEWRGGILFADAPAPGGTVFVDVPADQALPAAHVPAAAAPAPSLAALPVGAIVASDNPGQGGADPRDTSSSPQVISPELIAKVKAAYVPPPQPPQPLPQTAKRVQKAAKKGGK